MCNEFKRYGSYQVHKCFLIFYCNLFVGFSNCLTMYIARFQFFPPDRRLIDRQTDGQKRLLNPASRMRARGNKEVEEVMSVKGKKRGQYRQSYRQCEVIVPPHRKKSDHTLAKHHGEWSNDCSRFFFASTAY